MYEKQSYQFIFLHHFADHMRPYPYLTLVEMLLYVLVLIFIL